MCHLDGLDIAKEPLPLPGDLKYIWANITKVIDARNHGDTTCQEKYSFERIKSEHPN